jgi:hypothetical protein
MEHRIKHLANIANDLDKKGLMKTASKIDAVSDNILKIVTAQYVGVQGYWIQNERCWDNCYRNNRAKFPKKPAQVIWQDCQNEYVESINNPDSGWAKYASEKRPVLSKYAQQIADHEDEYFINTVEIKIANGMSIPVAVYDTINSKHASRLDEFLLESTKLLKIANTLNQKGHTDIAARLASEANAMIKEAGIGDWAKSIGNKAKDLAGRAGRGIAENLFGLGGKDIFNQTMDGIKNMIIQLNMVLRKHAGYLDPLAADPETNQAALQNYLQKNFGSLDAQVGKVNDTIDAFSGQDFGMFGNKYKKNIQNMAAQFGQFYNNVTEAGKTLINNPTAFVESLKALLPFIQQSANNIDAVKQEAEQTVAQQAATQQAATPSNETADALRNMDRNQNGTPDNQEAAPPVPVDPNGQPVQQKPLNDVINTVNQVLSPKGIQQMSPDNKAQWAEMFKGWLKQLEGTYSK